MWTKREFFTWLVRHQRLCPHAGWKTYGLLPDGRRDPLVWQTWIAYFANRGITVELANQASDRLVGSHPGWPEAHLAAVLDEVGAIRCEEAAERAAAERRRARAEADRLHERRDRLRAVWASLDEDRRAAIRADVEARHPELRRFRTFIEAFCLEELVAPTRGVD